MISTNRHKLVNAHITEGMAKQLKARAKAGGTTVSRLIYGLLLRYLKRHFEEVEEEVK